MPYEYTGFGHVSEKTDAFSFGIVLIELVTNLHPLKARKLVELTTGDVGDDICIHDGARAIGWPLPVLRSVGDMVTSLTEGKANRRGSMHQEIRNLENEVDKLQ